MDKEAKAKLIEYWCEVAALNAAEAGICFGHGRYEDGHKCLLKAVGADIQLLEIQITELKEMINANPSNND